MMRIRCTIPWPLAFLAAVAVLLALTGPTLADNDPWPKKLQDAKGTVILYQPQLEDFEGDMIKAFAAISVQTKEMSKPMFGALWLEGRVATDRDTRMATIDQVILLDVKLPDAKPEEFEKLKKFLDEEMAAWAIPISLDRLVAGMDLLERKWAGDQGLNNDPPKIIFRSKSAVLVPLDGDPRLLRIPDSRIMQVVNTPFTMVFDPVAKAYYLWGGGDWLSASEITGPWTELKTLPEDLKKLMASIEEKAAESARQRGLQPPPQERAKRTGPLPEIIVSTVPAELLVTDGEPQFTPIAGTGLLFVSNTESSIFKDAASQDYYVLISGRWFTAKSLADGPFSYVAPDKLPAGFAKIPPESPKGFVLASVAGTVQAREAVLENFVPQTAVIDRHKATFTGQFAGEPQFSQIPGTDLEYAVNTDTSMFRKGGKYFALDQGIWFEADSATGPWQVATATPPFLEQISPSNPHYNARYVKVFAFTDDTVTVGYTPGYTGSFVNNDTVVFGTGFNYRPFASETAFIPFQATYGHAAVFDPHAGAWGFQPSYYSPARWLAPGLVGYGLGVLTGRAIWGDRWFWDGGGWWGRRGHHTTNININHNNIHNRRWNTGNRWPERRPGDRWAEDRWRPDRERVDRWRPERERKDRWADRRPGERPWTRPDGDNIYQRPWNRGNLAERPGRPGERPGLRPERPGGQVVGRPERPGLRPERPGGQVVGRPERPAVRPERPGGQVVARPERPAVRPERPQARPAGGRNNVVADRDGNVFRRDQRGNLQQRQGNQWASLDGQRPGTRPEARPAARPSQRPREVSRPTPRPADRSNVDRNRINRDFQARQRGEVRTQNSQRRQNSPSVRGAGGGGGRGGVSRPSGGADRGAGQARPAGGGGGRGGAASGRQR